MKKHPLLVVSLLIGNVLASSAHAAILTWAPGGFGTTGGSGTWSTSAANWDNGVSNAAWPSVLATQQTTDALFSGTDGSYTVTVGGNFSAQSATFSASGYTLQAASAQTISLANSGFVSVATGKTASVGNNATITRASTVAVQGGGTLALLAGGTLSSTASSALGVTISGGSTLSVQGGSLVSAGAGAPIVVGNGNSQSNALTITSGLVNTGASFGAGTTGGGLRLLTGSVTNSTATVNLAGGVLATARVYQGAAGAGSTSLFNFDGGTLRATATNNTNFMTGITQANIKAGGARIDTNGFDVTIGQALLHSGTGTDGGLTKSGVGTLILGGVNTYNGSTTVTSGTMALGASGSITSSQSVNINAGASFDTTAQSFTMLGGQTFKFTLDPAGAGSSGFVNAASLNITNGVVDFSALGTLDDSFYVLAHYTSLTGSAFATVNNLPAGYTLDYNYLGGNNIALIAVPEPGALSLLVCGGIGMMAFGRKRLRSRE